MTREQASNQLIAAIKIAVRRGAFEMEEVVSIHEALQVVTNPTPAQPQEQEASAKV